MFKQHKSELIPQNGSTWYFRGSEPLLPEWDDWYWGGRPQVQEMGPAERAIREQVAANMGMAFVEPKPTPIEKYSMLDVDFTALEARVFAWARSAKADAYGWAYGKHFAGVERQEDVYRYISGTLGPNTITGRFSSHDPNPYISERARNLAPFSGGHLDREREDLRERTAVKKQDPRCGFVGQCGV